MPKPSATVRRPEIVRAAIHALQKNGLPLPSYDLIAQEAGMSRPLIRHYFPDPEKLMIAVCDALADGYRDLLMRGVLEAGTMERLPMFLDFFFNLLAGKGLEKPLDDAAYDAMFSLAAGSGAVRENLRCQYGLLQHTIAHEVQVSNPGLSQRACREIGYLFVSLMYGHWKMVATLGFAAEDHNRITRAAMDRIIASYNARYTAPDEEDDGDGPED